MGAENITGGVFSSSSHNIQNITITVDDLNFWYTFNVKYTISAGCQFGALFIMFFVTWIMTSEGKRSTPVFILNMLSLGFGALRSLFSMLSEISNFNSFYTWFTNDLTYITPGDKAVSILGIIFQWLMLVFINMSLVLNAYTVCKTLTKRFRYPIIAVSIFFMVATSVVRFIQLVLNIQSVLGTSYWILQKKNVWFTRYICLAFETGGIWWFCFIFSGMLILAQKERSKMGMKRWPATQLLSSMAGATMVVPSIFCILEWTARLQMPFAFTLSLTLVALLLPLSSLWASKITRDGAVECTSKRLWGGHHVTPLSSDDRYGSATGKVSFRSASTRDTDPRTGERRPSQQPLTASLTGRNEVSESSVSSVPNIDSSDLDLEKNGVHVSKTYSVHSGREL